MSLRLFLWAVTSALAGFLFGFDIVVISGAEQELQEQWSLSDGLHGLAMSMALWGTVVGALVGGWPADRYGRKRTLICIGALYFASAVGSALAPEVYSFMLARFVGGLGVGASTVAAPLYITEIAPASLRGRLTGMFQFNIVAGILVAFASNAALAGLGEDAWRWMLGVEAIPALLYTVGCFGIPRSPRWLILKRGAREEARAVLRQTHPAAGEAGWDRLVEEVERSVPEAGSARPRFWTAKLRVPILLAFLVAFFNQLSGINAILFFAPRIFELTGLGEQAALLQSVGIGATNLVFTFVGLYLIDRLGRRALLTIGAFGYVVSLALCAWAFHTERFAIVPPCIFAFIAAHAVGQGAVIWVLISEIFPNENRAQGQTLGSSTHWVLAALVTLVFPSVVSAFAPAAIFLFFCSMMVLQIVWIRLMVPETNGVALEEMQQHLGVRS